MSRKPKAYRLEEDLVKEIDEFKDLINKWTLFPPRSETDVIHFLLRKGLKEAKKLTPPKPGCLEAFRQAQTEAEVSDEPG